MYVYFQIFNALALYGVRYKTAVCNFLASVIAVIYITSIQTHTCMHTCIPAKYVHEQYNEDNNGVRI